MEDILKKTIKLYLGEHILKRVLELGDKAFDLNTVEKEITMMSLDILPFITLKRRHSTDELNDFLNDYLAKMFSTIKKYDGIINSVIGNSILAYWDSTAHAKHACECGLESLKISKQISGNWQKKDMPELITTVGINTGNISIGNYGSEERMHFTIIGEQVNFTERLQSANKNFNTTILISEKTKSLIENEFEIEHVQEVRIKGKTEPINLYTIN